MKILKRRAFTKNFIFVILSIIFIISIPTLLIVIHSLQNTQHSVTSSAPQPTHPTASWKAHAMAWIYPGPPTCNSAKEYKDGRVIDTLKPEYYTLNTSGTLILLTTANNGCNAYSQGNALEIKK